MVCTHYASDNSSLPTNLIYKIVTDKNGYIWLATDKGLVRYNGREFVTINVGKKEDFVYCCMLQRDVLLLMSETGRTIGMNLSTQTLINTDSLYQLDKIPTANRAWLLAYRYGDTLDLQKIYKNQFARIQLSKHSSHLETGEFFFERLLHHYHLNTQEITANSLLKYFTLKSYSIQIKDSSLTVNNRIYVRPPGKQTTLLFDGKQWGLNEPILDYKRVNNDLWVGCIEGAGLLCYRDYFSSKKENLVVDTILANVAITSIASDVAGNIWVGTYRQGLYLFRHADLRSVFHKTDIQAVIIEQPTPGIVAIGYENGLLELYASNNYIENKNKLLYHSKFSDPIKQITFVGNTCFVFTLRGCYQSRLNDKHLPIYFTKLLNGFSYKDGKYFDSTCYFAASNYLYAIYKNNFKLVRCDTGLSLTNIHTLQPIGANRFLIGTGDGIYIDNQKANYLENITVTKIRLYERVIIFCTEEGAYSIDSSNIYTGKDIRKLVGKSCYDVKWFGNFLYFKTEKGLLVINKSNGAVVGDFCSLKYTDPFSITDFLITGNTVIAAGNKGIFYMPEGNMRYPAVISIPPIHILNSLAGYRPNDTAYTCRYVSNQKIFFDLDVLNYADRNEIIDYRILKDGELLYDWTRINTNPLINLFNPAPGKYLVTYRVVSQEDGWQKTVRYTLIVTPLWWQTWWSLLLAGLILVVLVGLCIKWYIRSLLRRNNRKLQQQLHLYELESKKLYAQMNPHFIFNSIAIAHSLVETGQGKKASGFLSGFANLLRNILNASTEQYITLEQEREVLVQYLQLQQIRLESEFKWTIDIEPGIDQKKTLLSPMMLQPFVENAVEHGIRILPEGVGEIRIIINMEKPGCLKCTITDNGVGIEHTTNRKKEHTSLAIHITKERLALLGQQKKCPSGISIEPLNPVNTNYQGTKITLLIPLTS